MAVEIRIGDALDQLREMPPESVHCCVTSPPYWGLRDYGVDGQIGLEETPDEWCARLVEVFREVKRVLREDGTLWVNVGDSYASSGVSGKGALDKLGERLGTGGGHKHSATLLGRSPTPDGCKAKDLIGQPWLLAFALRADGWFLRDAIVWNKPNPMPSSAKDRCTGAYEHVFLLSKSARYFFDAEAIKQPAADSVLARSKYLSGGTKISLNGDRNDGDKGQRTSFRDWENGRNCRNVWTIATEAFSGSHFAVFPTELARRCILAGTSAKGVCAQCGAPWERETDITYEKSPAHGAGSMVGRHDASGQNNFDGSKMPRLSKVTTTTGWHPSCKCDADLAQATVLDPFGGAGTTGLVADRLQRNAVLIELNADYAAMARRRIDTDRGDLLDIIEQPKPEQGSLCLVP